MQLRNAFRELRRRHVFRVTGAYLVVGFIVVQVADLVFPALGFPDWLLSVLVVLVLLGLPIALVFAWALQLTPEGIEVTKGLQLDSTSTRYDEAVSGAAHNDGTAALRDLRPAVAILPFETIGQDPEHSAFADGLTEDVIAQVARIRAIKVISRTSAMRFKDTELELAEIANVLSVSSLLQGTVRRADERLRVVVKLVDPRSDQHLWAETYDARVEDVFGIQSDIALQIAQALRTSLTADEVQRLRTQGTGSTEAYDLYLLGRHHWYRFTPDAIEKARDYFSRALNLDPHYAPAYVGLADTYLTLGGAPLNVVPVAEAFPKVKGAATKAIDLDPMNGGAYESLALAQCWFEGDWEGARSTAIRGIRVDPNSSLAWTAYAHTHDICGMHREAARGVSRFLDLDPLSPLYHTVGAQVHGHARNYSEAERLLRRAEELNPEFPPRVFVEAEVRLAQGKEAEALAVIEPWAERMKAFDYGMAILGLALARNERRDEALRIAHELERQCEEGRATWTDVALIHLGLGSREGALEFLDRAAREELHGGLLTAYLAVHPLFDPLRAERRFRNVLRSLNLEDYTRSTVSIGDEF